MSRLLVVEDDPDIAMALRLLLTRAGHQVAHAKDGRTGLRDAYTERPELVILDIGLPGMDGYEVARTLRADPATRGLLLVALTGYGTDADRQRALEAGFDRHITKPLSREALEAALAALPRSAQA